MKNPTRKQLAAALKKKRKQLGFSVRIAAKELKISAATYSRIENARPMTLETYMSAVKWVDELL